MQPEADRTGADIVRKTVSAPVFFCITLNRNNMKRTNQEPVRTRRQILEEQGYKRFDLRDRETGEVAYTCWAKTRRNAVRQWRYHRKKGDIDPDLIRDYGEFDE